MQYIVDGQKLSVADDFVGADMARKFLQIDFTRARRYKNYKGGRKYHAKTVEFLEKGTGDADKAIIANLFYQKWLQAKAEPRYKKLKINWKTQYG